MVEAKVTDVGKFLEIRILLAALVFSRGDTGSGVFLFLPFFPSPPELRLLEPPALIHDFPGTYRKLC